MSRANAILILYHGESITADTAAALNLVLLQYGVIQTPDDAIIKHFDADSIAKLLTKEEIKNICIDGENSVRFVQLSTNENENEAIRSAITLIGTMFAESLKEGMETGNFSKFATDLILNSEDVRVANAIEIIATHHGKVSKALLTKYRMKGGALETVRDIYGTLPRFH